MNLSDEEKQLLVEAREKKDWSNLKSWKLRFLYQRHVALPGGRVGQVVEISRLASKTLGKDLPPSVAIPLSTYTNEAGEDLPF